ncbi:MAG: hypothetical protein ACFBZ9_05360 [Sphingomonadales bacterium]
MQRIFKAVAAIFVAAFLATAPAQADQCQDAVQVAMNKSKKHGWDVEDLRGRFDTIFVGYTGNLDCEDVRRAATSLDKSRWSLSAFMKSCDSLRRSCTAGQADSMIASCDDAIGHSSRMLDDSERLLNNVAGRC